MAQKIVAIGGGSLKLKQTLNIDKEIIKLSGKKKPKVLFIPTASLDNQDYIDTFTSYFQDLGCAVEVLCLTKEVLSFPEIEAKIEASDIIYVGGGNTLRMMKLWRRLKIDMLLDQAKQKGTVLCGLSAGSICWFNHGNSDSRKFKNPNADYIKVKGLGFIDALHCPHYDTESDRKESLKKMAKKYNGVSIALEDCVAICIKDDTYRIVTSNKDSKAYKIYYKDGQYYEEVIKETDHFNRLDFLLKK